MASTAVSTATASPSTFQLTPPEVLAPVDKEVAKTAVPLPPETQAAVAQQVDRYVHALLAENVHSEAFKAKLNSAFALG